MKGFLSRLLLHSIGLVLAASWVASAGESKTIIEAGFQARSETWKIERKDFGKADFLDGGWGYDPILEDDAGASPLGLGARLHRGHLFAQASRVEGEGSFDSLGVVSVGMWGADLGLTTADGRFGGFAGYRSLRLDCSPNVYGLEDQTIYDIMIGFLGQTSPGKPGLILRAEVAFGLRGLVSAISKGDSDTNAPPRSDSVFEMEAGLGYRIPKVPLALCLGYGFWRWDDMIRDYSPERDTVEAAIARNHGPVLQISYVFGG